MTGRIGAWLFCVTASAGVYWAAGTDVKTPVITVVEQPELPARPDKRRWVLVESFALIVGLFFAVLLAYGRTSFGAYRDAEVDESTELNRAVHEFRQQWRQPKRLIRTLVGR